MSLVTDLDNKIIFFAVMSDSVEIVKTDYHSHENKYFFLIWAMGSLSNATVLIQLFKSVIVVTIGLHLQNSIFKQRILHRITRRFYPLQLIIYQCCLF